MSFQFMDNQYVLSILFIENISFQYFILFTGDKCFPLIHMYLIHYLQTANVFFSSIYYKPFTDSKHVFSMLHKQFTDDIFQYCRKKS